MDCIKCRTPLPNGAVYCLACGKKQAVAKKSRHAKRYNTAGTITKRSGKRGKPYWARLLARYHNGIVERKSLGCFATYAEADRALQAASNQIIVHPIYTETLQTIYDSFLGSNYFATLTPSAQSSHKTAWRNLLPVAETPTSSITKATFQASIDAMQQRNLKRETMAKVRNLASLLCKEAMGLGLLSINYGQLVQLPRADKGQQASYSSAQLKALWQATDQGDSNAMAVLLMCYTGMRPGELLGIQIEQHLHLSDHANYFRTGSKTEAGRDRIIPIAPLILPLVETLRRGRASGPLLTSSNGNAYRLDTWRNRNFKPLMERLDICGTTPYTCRHTFADLQKRRQVDPETMMVIMGHEDYATTVEHYHTTTDEDITHLCDALADMSRPA